ncbi:MAG: SRPBCC domain-containing protein [Verrucomicrobiota bacterium]
MSTVTTPEQLKLSLTRVFAAPRELVFEACTKKEHMDRWMCPHGFTIPESGGELRAGGSWHCVMIAPNGERCPVAGVYEQVVPNELLVFTHAWEGDDGKPEHWTTVTMRFEDAGEGRTRLTLEQSVFRSQESRDRHVGGWTQCLEKLAGLLERPANIN